MSKARLNLGWHNAETEKPPVDVLVVAYYPRWSEVEDGEESFEEEHISPAKFEGKKWFSPDGDFMGQPSLWITFDQLLVTIDKLTGGKP